MLPLNLNLPAQAAARFDLGAVAGVPEPRHGGVNQLWRVRTERGDFAIHAMHPRPALLERCDAVLALEVAAADAGVVVATPVPDPGTGRAATRFDGLDGPVVVHEWVAAEPVHVDRCPPGLYRRLGASVARIHGLAFDPAGFPGDLLDRRTAVDEWRGIADDARQLGLAWAGTIGDAADELVAAIDEVDRWDATSGDERVTGHRDLTSQNILDLDGTPVLIDWEDAGAIAAGNDLGRTALDNVARDGVLDDDRLRAMLVGYREVRPLPPLGPHWCSLWVRGLVVFVEHCARSCIHGTADAGLLRLQSDVIERALPELRRRFELLPSLLASFELATASL